MIPREEILDSARQQGLNPDVIEKDYVLGWLLMKIARHPLLGQWVFKGGTCLKKCFFETYRFSEDLDFTVPKGVTYEGEAYRTALVECAEALSDETGIQLPQSGIEVRESHDKGDRLTFQGRMSYRGPLMNQIATLPRVKIDLTQHEVIVETPQRRRIHHFYSDAPDPPVSILCYTANEVLAEKTRALYERQGRARDLYDVVNIDRNHREEIDAGQNRVVLQKKFEFKGLSLPPLAEFIGSIDRATLQANWDQQLRHQLPVLPSPDSYLQELQETALAWIEARAVIKELPRVRVEPGEVVVPRVAFPQMATSGLSVGVPRVRSFAALGGPIDSIRYAARNRLCAEIHYHGVQRLTEPYSLRIKGTGDLLLYAYELLRGGARTETIKAYKVAEIQGARITEQPFQPRYAVEL